MLRSRVLVVDNYPVERHGLTHLLDREPDLITCGEATDAQQALEAVASLHPDGMILALEQPWNGLMNLLNRLQHQAPNLRVLVVSTYHEQFFAERVLEAGARGYILKQEPTDTLLLALRRILQGEIYVSEQVVARILHKAVGTSGRSDDDPLSHLSNREIEVLHLLGQGKTSRQIADMLHLSVKTIDTYRARLMQKLSLDSATELVQYAIRWTHR